MANVTHQRDGLDLEGGSAGGRAMAWLAHKVGVRAAAAGWWIVMVAFDLALVSMWLGIARDPSWVAAGLGAAITLAVGIPIVHEWPSARRMGRLLVHGA